MDDTRTYYHTLGKVRYIWGLKVIILQLINPHLASGARTNTPEIGLARLATTHLPTTLFTIYLL